MKIDLNSVKKKIEQSLKAKPNYANNLSLEIGIPGMIISAVLSEMAREKTIKSSWLKVGSGAVYYTEESKAGLENFLQCLEQKEKEVFQILKQKGIINDNDAEPAHRVALRSIKDFAVPIKATINGEEKLFWKFFTLQDEQLHEKLVALEVRKKEKKKEIEAKEQAPEIKAEIKKEEIKETLGNKVSGAPKTREFSREPAKTRKKKEEGLTEELKSWISENNLKMLDEGGMIVESSSSIGALKFLLVLKTKKTITEEDIILAYHQGQEKKLPVIFLADGKLAKKAEEYALALGSYFILKHFQAR